MRVSVLLFAGAREAAGAGSIEVEVPEPATAAAVLGALGPIARRARLAVNHTFATAATPIGPGDEVALIPPVGGG